jgi:hypothetical protein
MRLESLNLLRPQLALAVVALIAAIGVAGANERTYRVTVTNLTQGQVFSPPLAVAHSVDVSLFEGGEAASPELAALAEDGMTGPLVDALTGAAGVYGTGTADGPIPPGASRSFEVEAGAGAGVLSVVGMLVQTNDAFFFAQLPDPPDAVFLVPGTGQRIDFARTSLANAYDAGSEANTESCEHIPGPPCGNAGVRVTEGAEGFVHISQGIQGVADDLAPSQYDWRNPVARVSVERVD